MSNLHLMPQLLPLCHQQKIKRTGNSEVGSVLSSFNMANICIFLKKANHWFCSFLWWDTVPLRHQTILFRLQQATMIRLYVYWFVPSCVKITMQMHPLPKCRRPKGNQAAKRKLCRIIPLAILFRIHKRIWTRECWKGFEAMCWGKKWVLLLGTFWLFG